MKKTLTILAAAMLLQLSGSLGRTQPFTPTTCPTNFSCSIIGSGTRAIVGAATDGQPSAILGFVSFDESSNVSGFFAANNNGTTTTFDLEGATCVSGTGGNLGTIDFTSKSGHPMVFDFVTYQGSAGRGVLLANATPSATNSTDVMVARCMSAPLL